MAAAFGKSIAPPMSGGGSSFRYNLHLVSALPLAGTPVERVSPRRFEGCMLRAVSKR
jgi:hypothetical protein